MGGLSPYRAALMAFVCLANPLSAQDTAGDKTPNPASPSASAKFRIDGTRLIYDTVNTPEGVRSSVELGDAETFLDLLQATDGITVVELNSSGGSLWAASRMAATIIDFELDTHVNGECASTCTRILLAGSRRTMARGSRIGFHQSYWTPDSIRSYYESEAKDEGWDSPFEFASWVYSDTQTEVHELLIYMIRRGVDPVFAIETLAATSDSMWYPYRARLLAAGVLTE